MNFLRPDDHLMGYLSHNQAEIFEKSVEDGYPSKLFIKAFMLNNEVRYIDDLDLNRDGVNFEDIYTSTVNKIKNKTGELLPYNVMHFIGYFYRAASYLTKYPSKQLYQLIPVDLLVRNYVTLHTFDITEAIREVFELLNLEQNDLYQRFKEIYPKY